MKSARAPQDTVANADLNDHMILWMLNERSARLGMDNKSFATRELKISYKYYAALRSGSKPISAIGPTLLLRISSILKLPPIIVRMAIGQLQPSDFYQQPANLDRDVLNALKFIQNDPRWIGYFSTEIFKASLPLQHFVVLLYEAASKRRLLPERKTLEELQSTMQRIKGRPRNA